jgi:hypothetical protein
MDSLRRARPEQDRLQQVDRAIALYSRRRLVIDA